MNPTQSCFTFRTTSPSSKTSSAQPIALQQQRRYARLKRTVDVLAGGAALLALSPLMLTTAYLIKRQDGGPLLFRQTRVGENGRHFPMLKFRSMVVDAERLRGQIATQNKHQSGPTFKIENDPRITPLGRFIRKYSIDELPQLINVLRGEMSLVGPRPAIPSEVATYESRHLPRLAPKPGITCFWQVGGRANIDFEGQVVLDKRYRREASLLTDFLLLLKTIPAVLSSKGSY